jgi:hypothetical protein
MRKAQAEIEQYYLSHDFITEQKLADLYFDQRQNLRSPQIKKLVQARVLSFERAVALRVRQRHILQQNPGMVVSLIEGQKGLYIELIDRPELIRYVEEGLMSIDYAQGLSDPLVQTLSRPGVQSLVLAEKLTVSRALSLKPEALVALNDRETVHRVICGDLTLDELLDAPPERRQQTDDSSSASCSSPNCSNSAGRAVGIPIEMFQMMVEDMIAQDPNLPSSGTVSFRIEAPEGGAPIRMVIDVTPFSQEPTQQPLNSPQSTHTASVHKSVSRSAAALLKRYGEVSALTDDELVDLLEIDLGLLNQSAHKDCALRGFKRITAPDYTFTDPESKITIKKLLSLIFSVIHSDDKLCDETQALQHLANALNEIQRGYNASADGVDDGAKKDKFICKAGAFNKIIEHFVGVHPDCNIRFVTPKTASMKLLIVAQEEAFALCSLLLQQPQVLRAVGLDRLLFVLFNAVNEDLELLWPSISTAVSQRMKAEFAEDLGETLNDDFINAAVYQRLSVSAELRKVMYYSLAYHGFMSTVLATRLPALLQTKYPKAETSSCLRSVIPSVISRAGKKSNDTIGIALSLPQRGLSAAQLSSP